MSNRIVCVIGLGYVGLQVAIAFSKKQITYGFDIDKKKINDLCKFIDVTNQVSKRELNNKNLILTNNLETIINVNFYIIAVPTPVKEDLTPNLQYIIKATSNLAKSLKKNDIVVYESTVYPGLTEEICIPLLEKISKLKCGKDFNVSYSPERINPNDKKHTFVNTKKLVSAQNKKTLNIVSRVYSLVIKNKIIKVSSIKVAEAAKVIENAQRDINIAFINELSIIFDKMNIDTYSVLKAASTKWNFLNFKPGLVGGHCIGIDPYYLTYKSKKFGYSPNIITAGRKINDSMSKHIVKLIVEKITKYHKHANTRINILGYAFKENCNDIRNSKVKDLVENLMKKNFIVDVCDPIADKYEIKKIKNIKFVSLNKLQKSHITVLTVPHDVFNSISFDKWKSIIHNNGYLFDIKQSIKNKRITNNNFFNYFTL